MLSHSSRKPGADNRRAGKGQGKEGRTWSTWAGARVPGSPGLDDDWLATPDPERAQATRLEGGEAVEAGDQSASSQGGSRGQARCRAGMRGADSSLCCCLDRDQDGGCGGLREPRLALDF